MLLRMSLALDCTLVYTQAEMHQKPLVKLYFYCFLRKQYKPTETVRRPRKPKVRSLRMSYPVQSMHDEMVMHLAESAIFEGITRARWGAGY